MSIMNHPRIVMLATSSLTPTPDNARTHSPKQIGQLAASIEKFGWLVPLVCDGALNILAGEARWLAAKKLALSEVPVILADHLSDIDKRAFALADNRLAELAGWDEKKLQKELDAIFSAGIELETIGFSSADLTFQLVEDAEGQVPDPEPAGHAVTRPGDCWLIGGHRLVCGNSLDADIVEHALNGRLSAMVFDDPPYNLPVNGFVRSAQSGFREFAFASGEMSPPEFTAFLRSAFRNCVRFSKKGSIHYHCMDWRHIREILDAADGVYDEFKQLVVWDKQVGGQGAFYRSQHELIFVFKSGKAKHINNFGLGETGRYRTNVWSYPGANSFRRGREADLAAHVTCKPIPLVMDAIRDCSNRGDVILDLFTGSGVTLIAAHKTGRIGVGVEIDPLYVDVALKRLAAATGLVPILEADGRTFHEVAADRCADKEG